MIDLDAGDVGTAMLRQATYWKMRLDDGRLQLVHLDQLGTHHRRHLLAWLRANAALMQAHEARAIARQHKAGHLDDASFAAAMRPLETLAPQVWLDDTALVRRLIQITPPGPPPAPRQRRYLPWRKR